MTRAAKQAAAAKLAPATGQAPASGTPPAARPAPAASPAPAARHRLIRAITVATILLLVALVAGVSIGPADLSPGEIARSLAIHLPWHPAVAVPQIDAAIIWQIRLPRVVLGALVGAMLSGAGAAYQGVFRNPLADPYLLGVAAGAGLGATAVIVSGASPALLPIAAFCGAAVAVTAAYSLGVHAGRRGDYAMGTDALAPAGVPASQRARRRAGTAGVPGGRPPGPARRSGVRDEGRRRLQRRPEASGIGTAPAGTASVLLAGIAIAALFTAAQTYLQQAHSQDLQSVYAWILGGLSGATWSQVALISPYALIAGVTLLAHRRLLDVLRVGELEAGSLGVHVARLRLTVVVAATLAAAAAVSVSGLIGFVGIIVPHLTRLTAGPSYRIVLPVSMIGGAAFLVLTDIAARTVQAPAETPIGVLTAAVGAPFFLFVLRSARARQSVL